MLSFEALESTLQTPKPPTGCIEDRGYVEGGGGLSKSGPLVGSMVQKELPVYNNPLTLQP